MPSLAVEDSTETEDDDSGLGTGIIVIIIVCAVIVIGAIVAAILIARKRKMQKRMNIQPMTDGRVEMKSSSNPKVPQISVGAIGQ